MKPKIIICLVVITATIIGISCYFYLENATQSQNYNPPTAESVKEEMQKMDSLSKDSINLKKSETTIVPTNNNPTEKNAEASNNWLFGCGIFLSIVNILLIINCLYNKQKITQLQKRVQQFEKNSANSNYFTPKSSNVVDSSIYNKDKRDIYDRLSKLEKKFDKSFSKPSQIEPTKIITTPNSTKVNNEPLKQGSSQEGYFETAIEGSNRLGYFNKLSYHKEQDSRFIAKISGKTAEFTPIIDIANIIAMDYMDFVIEFTGVSKKDATGMKIIRPGIVELSDDGTWNVTKKIKLELTK